MNKQILLFLLFFPFTVFSQECDCESNYKWVKKTIEENDAGFSYLIQRKGLDAYEKHNEIFYQKVKGISNPMECEEALKAWLAFFRSGHIGIKHSGANKLSNDQIIELYKDSERIDVDLEAFTNYLESKKEVDYEGVWLLGSYKIGIKKVDNNYLGFIIEADGVYWSKGQIKFKINSDNSSVYYLRDHSERTYSNTKLLGDNYIQAGRVILKRIAPGFKCNPKIDQYFEMVTTKKPYFESINRETAYLRIPTFRGTEKSNIDSVILANKELILKTPNLIVDIRYNGGGSDRSYKELLPILYTNPIRTVGVELLSTPLNNKRMLDFINDPKYGFDDKGKKWAKESFDKLSKHMGEFVDLDSSAVDITKYDTIHPFPQNIAILINESNGSTSEQFLLAAKQSKKVKLYGTTTAGVLDISNMYGVESPDGDFKLGYSLSKSMRVPEMTIDDKGIQPDYYIDKSIPKYEWIEFVVKSLNE